MVDDEITAGERIARLLSSEVHGHERGSLGHLAVVDAESDVEPTVDGAFAYAVELEDEADPADGADGGGDTEGEDRAVGEGDADESRRIADVYVHPDRAHVEFREGVEPAAAAGEEVGLRVRPKAVEPPRTLVFVENGAEVKAALRVFRAVADGRLEDAG